MPPFQNQTIAGYVAGDKHTESRVVPSIPTGRTLTKCWFTIKKDVADADPGVLQKVIQTSTGAGIGTITDTGDGAGSTGQPVGTGAFFFDFTPTDTGTTLGPGIVWQYDIQMLFDNGDVATLELGTISFIHGVTGATS